MAVIAIKCSIFPKFISILRNTVHNTAAISRNWNSLKQKNSLISQKVSFYWCKNVTSENIFIHPRHKMGKGDVSIKSISITSTCISNKKENPLPGSREKIDTIDYFLLFSKFFKLNKVVFTWSEFRNPKIKLNNRICYNRLLSLVL